MQELKLEKSTAIRLFEKVPEWFQETLIATFGKECFSKSIFDRIKTFEDACEAMNKKPEDVYHEKDAPDDVARKKLKVIAEALNGGWVPDWNDTNQKKRYPWFKMSSGFGFDRSVYGYGCTDAGCGSRLCLSSNELSNYFGTQFIDLHEIHLTK